MESSTHSAAHQDPGETVSLPWYQDRVLLCIIALAAVLGLLYNGVMILGKGADEPRHMAYVRLLLNEHTLPFLEPDPTHPAHMREHAGAHTLHPPVYYLLLLPFYALLHPLGEGLSWHVARVVSLTLCLAALPLIYQIALRAGTPSRALARLAVAQVALLPIFGMTAGTINNDSATLLAVVAFLWLLTVRYARDRSLGSAAVLGLGFGVGALCKATAVICDGAALLVYLVWLDGWPAVLRSPRAWARLAVIAGLVLVIAGSWYGRNFLLYHKFTPIESGYSPADMHWLPSTDQGLLVVLLHDNFPRIFALANWSIFYSMWSQKDWIPEAFRPFVYDALALYCGVAALGVVVARVRRAVKTSGGQLAIYGPAAAFAVNWVACLVIAVFVHWGWAEGGRYLLPSLCGLSIPLACGWAGWLGEHRLPALVASWCTALAALNVLTIYWLLHYLNPTFGATG